MRILNHDAVAAALAGQELRVLHSVQNAYLLHHIGETAVPFSSFLRPPGHPGDRIICLPAHLGGEHPIAGVKWISSFPGNVERGLQRASSIMIVNDLETGYPTAVLEASQISAWRTAASAALASHLLHGTDTVPTAGIVGCGTINLATLAFLTVVHPELRTVYVHDAVAAHARSFASRLGTLHPEIDFRVADLDRWIDSVATVSIATTDSTYWLDLPAAARRQVILHLSLRDLSERSILAGRNVVDDVDHALREQTSLHRTEQATGHRDFIETTLGQVIADGRWPRGDGRRPVIFSPFGLGVLDLAVADVVLTAARTGAYGLELDGFDPGRHDVTGRLPHPDHVPTDDPHRIDPTPKNFDQKGVHHG